MTRLVGRRKHHFLHTKTLTLFSFEFCIEFLPKDWRMKEEPQNLNCACLVLAKICWQIFWIWPMPKFKTNLFVNFWLIFAFRTQQSNKEWVLLFENMKLLVTICCYTGIYYKNLCRQNRKKNVSPKTKFLNLNELVLNHASWGNLKTAILTER